ncbi:Nn.00g089980.m01.CDS01 [Neocucurbitaria sp. VM-36]
MSQSHEIRIKGAAEGPYGPDNPPPPPPGSPPRVDANEARSGPSGTRPPRQPDARRRRRQQEWKREQNRFRKGRGRSRSPVRHEDRGWDTKYRERSALDRDREVGASASRSSRPRLRQVHEYDRSDDRAFDNVRQSEQTDRVQQQHDQYTGRRLDWEANRVGDELRVPGQVEHHRSFYDGHDRTRDMSSQRRDVWQRTTNAPDDGVHEHLSVVDDERASGYGPARHEIAPATVLTDPGFMIDDEVEWDDEPVEVADAFPTTALTGQDKQASRPFRSPDAPHNWQDRPRSPRSPGALTKGRGHPRDTSPERRYEHFSPIQDRSKSPFWDQPWHQSTAPQDGLAPPTAYDLRFYDHEITKKYEELPQQERFINGINGKVGPAVYGSTQRDDLGLCFSTFCTRFRCEMGLNCPWRHHPLNKAEKEWILAIGRERGKRFLDGVNRWWSSPDVPVPGASMVGKGH